MHNEDQLQQAIFVYFNNKYVIKNSGVIFSIPNGGSRNKIEAIKLKNTGLLPGASDLVLLLPNQKTIFVEVKHGKNKQTPNQIDFQNRVEKLGFQYWLVYSLEQFQELCRINVQL